MFDKYNSNRNSYEYVKKTIEDAGFILLEKTYVNNITKMLLVCKKGHIWDVTFSAFLSAHGLKCPHCNKELKNKQSIKDLQDYASIYGYYVYDQQDIQTRKSKFRMLCPNGHECFISYDKFKQGRRCKYCKNSRGENKIIECLFKYNITYETQFGFDDCKYVNKLLYDFYLPDYNCCIEFDGEQHFEPRFGEDEFSKTQIRDNIKNEYCNKHNIQLIRIPYWDYDNIENILIEELNLK